MRRSLWLCRVNLCIQAEEAQQPKIAEQPLSEVERDQVRRYRELQRFLKGSPFYVRPPRQSEHAGAWPCSPSQTRRATTARETTVLIVPGRAISADLARYSDQYHTSEDSAGPRLAEYVSQTSYTKCRAFPAELLARHGENPHARARAHPRRCCRCTNGFLRCETCCANQPDRPFCSRQPNECGVV